MGDDGGLAVIPHGQEHAAVGCACQYAVHARGQHDKRHAGMTGTVDKCHAAVDIGEAPFFWIECQDGALSAFRL